MIAEKIKENVVVAMNYQLKDDAGQLLDSSQQGAPLEYLHGHSNIIPGLERALAGMGVGEKKQVSIQPEEGYGQYNPELRFAVPAAQFQGAVPQVGMQFQLTSQSGESFVAQVVELSPEQVTLDANHPLAGKSLHFDVEITGLRAATAEELAHGHPHGPGGHHH
jgi:FKBP-type peptidyl-prolyl cis-trans isomerase SlyD